VAHNQGKKASNRNRAQKIPDVISIYELNAIVINAFKNLKGKLS
jgi:hypothetical protein